MRNKLGFIFLLTFLVFAQACNQPAHAQNLDRESEARFPGWPNIDDGRRVTLRGNTRPEARKENDRGEVDDDFPMRHMLLQLRRPPERERALQEFIDELHTPGSPNFHQWITAEEFGARFGVPQEDLNTVASWLQSYGFKVNVVYPSEMVIDFSGTAAEVRKAFHTSIRHLDVRGKSHIANDRDPQIPAALAPLITGIVSLHDFKPHAMHLMRRSGNFTFPDSFGGTNYAVVPADLATIYNLNPLFQAGYSGQGETIALIEDTDVFSAADWSSFRAAFGLSAYTSGSFSSVHPAAPMGSNNCGAPGVIAPNDAEAILDAEWASAAAPSAAIEMVACADTNTTFGGLIAIQNLLNAATPPPPIMSISYGQCETVNGAAANAAYRSAYQQAVTEGVSVFVAAGDSGAAGCDNSVAEATHGIGANAFASTPYNVAVGGTDFSDTYSGSNSAYWDSSNGSNFGSALSYIPETPWNDSCAGLLLSQYLGYSPTYGPDSLCNDPAFGSLVQSTVAGGGAPSGCATGTPSISGVVSGTCQGWPKPSWQAVLGNPSDGVRDTPDVSLFAADGLWSHFYVFCWSDTVNGGAACSGSPDNWSGAGGTSFAAPIMAGIQALVNQKTASRQGNPNPVYYQLAASEYGANGSASCSSDNGNNVSGSCVFYDVTFGDMDVDCVGPNCYLGGGAVGVLSTSNSTFAPSYAATKGWDFATGIGSVNAANLANHWPGSTVTPSFDLSATPGSLAITQGTSGSSTITVTAQNGFNGNVTLSASGLPSGVTASFSPSATNSSSTLTLSATSTATTGTTTVTISGVSGGLSSTTTLSLTINAAPVPNFTLSATPSSLTVAQGAGGTSTITVTPQNGFNGSVVLSASGLPSGVTASFSPSSTTNSSTLTLSASSSATTGPATVIVTGVSGSLTNTTPISLMVQATVVSNLPSGWSDLDIGSPGVAGSANYANNVFTVQGAGAQIYGSSDSFNFVYQPLSGDGMITARLLSLQGGSGYVTAGVMIRETLSAASTNAKTADWPTYSRIYFDLRSATAGTTAEPGSVSANLPYWVRVMRSGSAFSSYTSSDGVNWTQVGTTQTITMAQNVFIGLAVNSGTSTALATATFDNVSVTSAANPAPAITSVSASTGSIGSPVVITGSGFGATQGNSVVLLNGAPATVNTWSATAISITIPAGATSGPLLVSVAPAMNDSNAVTFTVTSQPLPSPWVDQDVGSVGVAGNASFSGGSFTVQGAGAQIYGTADAFHFVYQALNGDGTITARLVSMTGGSSFASAGVMIRETLDAASTNAKTADWPSFGRIYFDLRSNAGGATSEPANVSGNPPYWVRMSRSGNNFSSYTSVDGVNWVQLGTAQTINMAQTVYVGLAVDSGTTTGVATATFDNVALTTPSTTPPPNFTLSASPGSLAVTQGASGSSTITVTAQNGFNGNVSLSAAGLPSGVTASFNPSSATSSSTVTLSASSTAATGTATVTITGTSGSLSNSTTISLTVNAAPAPNFSLSAAPTSLTIAQGASGTSTITITPQNGFNGTVLLSASGLPSGVTASFNPSSATSSTLTLSASSTAATGTATVTITGTSGSLSNSTTISLTVNAAPAPNFALSAAPTSLTIAQGASGTSTITITPQNGFNGTVLLSAAGLPSGVTASFNPSSATSSSTLTLSASSTAATGTATVTITGTSGSLSNSTTISLSVQATAIPGLPAVWSDLDIGTPGVAGSATYANNVFTVQGAGAQIYGSSDSFNFLYQPLSGDGTITARLLSLSGGSGFVTAGVMIRESLTPGSTNAKTADWRTYGAIYFDVRTATGTNTTEPASVTTALPYWVRVSRAGNSFSSYASLDGVNWTQLGTPQTITMAQNVYIGLAVNSGTSSAVATATFDNISVNTAVAPAPVISNASATTGSIGSSVVITGTGFGAAQGGSMVFLNDTPTTVTAWADTSISIAIPAGATSGPLLVSVAPTMNDSNAVGFTVTSQPLPSPWLDQDVGSVGVAGTATFSSGTFTLQGAGAQIYGTADAFHFVYQPLTGDGTIVARLVSLQGGSTNVSAGVMIRETLAANSSNAKTADWRTYNAIYFDVRSTTGGNTVEPGSISAAMPYWIKVTRSGNSFSSYASSDGQTWVQVGTSQTINMGQSVYVGLAVDSGAAALATATFDNVSVTSP